VHSLDVTIPKTNLIAGKKRRFGQHERSPIRIGYVPLIDSAPLLIADALGLFQDAGINVRLERELGWGSIREKLVYGDLDAAHAPAGLLISTLCGLNSRARSVGTDLILNLQGNAITLSKRYWDKGVRDPSSFRQLVRSESPKKHVFAVASHQSTHFHLLRKWLRSIGLHPDQDVRTIVLPPPLVGEQMREGHIDGFCVGEPWNSAAVFSGEGWIVATSQEIAPLHPEKILLASDALRLGRAPEYAALRDALVTASQYCDTPTGRVQTVEILLQRELFALDREVISNSLVGPFQRAGGLPPDSSSFIYFFQNETNRATRDRALWFIDNLYETPGFAPPSARRKECLEAFIDCPKKLSPSRISRSVVVSTRE
jgi:ABC-type nitrate/sulfonate/bicarbonate transport system substrate-binding protein